MWMFVRHLLSFLALPFTVAVLVPWYVARRYEVVPAWPGWMLLGAGAVAVSADDTTGSNLALLGSDTLLQVTRDVLTACDGTVHYGTLPSSGNVTGLRLALRRHHPHLLRSAAVLHGYNGCLRNLIINGHTYDFRPHLQQGDALDGRGIGENVSTAILQYHRFKNR